MKLSIIIPIYNAEKIMESSLRSLMEAADSLHLDYEILLRDDGSVDGSRELLEKLSKEYACLKCFFNAVNVGLGFTLRELFRASQGDVIVYLDCDLPFGVEIIPVLLDEIKRHDIVIASRYNGTRSPIRLSRKIASRLYFLFCKMLFGIQVRDIGSGTVAIRREVINKLDLRAKGFDIHAELYMKAMRGGLKVKEIPARTSDIGVGTFRILRHGPRLVIDTVKLWLDCRN